MANTDLSSIIVPEVFQRYTIERTAALSAFVLSGIVERSPEFDDLASKGGRIVNMPFWRDLTGPRQVLSDDTLMTTARITAGQDAAVIHMDGNPWSVNDLASAASGEDPMKVIAEQVASYWARVDQDAILATLAGIFGSAGMAGNLHGIASETVAGQSETTRLNGLTFIDATQRLGDRGDRLTSIAMHSATEAALRKLDLIDYLPASNGRPMLRTFQGRNVIVDDALPVRDGTTDGKVYTSYLFGPGAFAQGVGRGDALPMDGGFGTWSVEYGRVPLASNSVLINRRRYILHPRGVKFLAADCAGVSPDNTELTNPLNWERVWEPKNVRIVAVVHNN